MSESESIDCLSSATASQSSSRLPEIYAEKFTFTKAIDSTSYQVKCNTCDKDLTVSKGSYKSINKHLTTCKKRKLSDCSTSCKKIPVLVSLTQKQQQFNSALLDFIVKDSSYVPLSIVNRKGFQTFIAQLLPTFNLPSRRTICRWLEKRSTSEHLKLREVLSKIPHFAITMDIWSRKNSDSHLCIVVHWTEAKTLQPVSRCLEFFVFNQKHTSANIATKVQQCLTFFGIASR